jgi:hypothetical protein
MGPEASVQPVEQPEHTAEVVQLPVGKEMPQEQVPESEAKIIPLKPEFKPYIEQNPTAAAEAREKIAAFADVTNEDLLRAENQLRSSTHANVETHAAPLTAELQNRGIQTISEAHTEAKAINEAMPVPQPPVKKKGIFSFLRRG